MSLPVFGACKLFYIQIDSLPRFCYFLSDPGDLVPDMQYRLRLDFAHPYETMQLIMVVAQYTDLLYREDTA